MESSGRRSAGAQELQKRDPEFGYLVFVVWTGIKSPAFVYWNLEACLEGVYTWFGE